MAYSFNILQGWNQTQVFRFIKGDTIHLKDNEDLIQICQNVFGDPHPVATVIAKLTNLTIERV